MVLACLWQLSFTLVGNMQTNKAEQYAEDAATAYQNTNAYNKLDEGDRAYALDSIRKVSNSWYIDSISAEKIYLGYTYKKVQEKEINLGLDLKGGMNVTLQVQLEDLVKALADNNKTPEFEAAMALARERSVASRSDFITLFKEAWDEVGNGIPLSQIFGTYEMSSRINSQTTDAQVIAVIRSEAESAISNSFNVLRNRIDRFGVTQPNIQQLGNSGRILVELPGVKEPERVRKLLQGTASLEFWATYDNSEIFPYLQEADNLLAEMLAAEEETTLEEVQIADEPPARPSVDAEETAEGNEEGESSILTEEIEAAMAEDDENFEAYKKAHPLFAALSPAINSGRVVGGACIGYANYADTAKINRWLHMPQIEALFPAEFKPIWTVHPSQYIPGDNTYELVAIKSTSRDGKAPLDGGVVTDARVQYNGQGGHPEVTMAMNAEGANIWARMTKDNIGKHIAIVLDGMVYSYPVVNTEITGGHSSITGNFDLDEAEDLANVLKSGKLPAPATIIQEQVVGPSLGAESIRAGLISFVLAFLLVLIYMICFYGGAGLVADAALLTNVLLLFGTLVSFGAVLTLPGIAGLVLTLGMAVDANVIIYERVKEELRAGKTFSKAVADGYSNAYSAIIDGQITTLLTGIVLFIFGSGPVQGFATTLIIGIITSVLTSIFISRIIIDDRIARGKTVSMGFKWSQNFLQNTHFDFIKARKWSYIASGAVILICLVSVFTKGFSYGVDFTGGRTFVVRFDQPVLAEDIRSATIDAFDGAVEVKQFGGESQMKITTQYKVNEETAEVDAEVEMMLYDALKDFFAEEQTFDDFRSTLDSPNGIISSDKVGPTIANDMKRNAVIAVVIALIVIFGYIALRFRKWTWGLGGVIGLAHTAFILVGFFSLFTGILPFSLDVDQVFIAAILTIIGYAINDTVVIFDRIREYKSLHPKTELAENTNAALNSTLSRTMNTSISTLIVLIAIAIFGGESIRGLAVALTLGVILGTYASIFIAAPLMYDMTVRSEKKQAEKLAAKTGQRVSKKK